MWNKEGTNILVALGQMAKVHEEHLSTASAYLANLIPSSADIERLVVELCGASTRMQRCWRLRDELSMANLEKRSLPEVMNAFIKELEEEEQRRRQMLEEGKGKNPGADHIEQVSLDALQALRETLLGFSNTPPAELKLVRQ